ncbi:MAG: hypothetical protein EHM47_07085 [Ignavibacteriales bacterium]|nr:MAG: hypothetical protein EHM47_07085 [Ignavibacteriales bacterium]
MFSLRFLGPVIFLISINCFAQYGSIEVKDARSIGMGKTANAVSEGLYSIGINPSNLISGKNNFEIATFLPLPIVTFRTGSDFISFDEFNYYFGGVNGEPRYLTEDDKKNLNSLLKDGGLLFASANVELFSFSYKPGKSVGAFAFSVYDIASLRMNIPTAIIDIALSGNPVGTTFNLDEGEIKGWWIRNYVLSYAKELPEIKILENFSAGISLKLIHGFSYVGTHQNSTHFTTGQGAEISGQTDITGYSSFSNNFGVSYDFDSISRESDFNLFPSPAGTGLGFDVGFSASLNDKWKFSLSVTDIGSINWSDNVAEFSSFGYIYLDDLTNREQRDSVKEIITGDSRKIESVSTSLATALRLGTAYLFGGDLKSWPGSLLIAFDYNQGFNDMPGNSLEPRFSVGTEWKPMNYFPYLRTGFSIGGERGFNWAFGLGIDAGLLELHFATTDMQSVFAPNSSKAISVSLSSRWKF